MQNSLKPHRILLLLSIAFTCLFAGCKKDKIETKDFKIPRIMVESRNVDYGGTGGNTIVLPVSGARISVNNAPLINEFQIANVELVRVELGMALLIQLNGAGSRELYRSSVTNMGSRLVLTINGTAIGARRIDGAIQDGNLYTFVELPPEELPELVADIKKTIVELGKRSSW
jgi:hypothetical protein